jgi:aminopeptidase N
VRITGFKYFTTDMKKCLLILSLLVGLNSISGAQTSTAPEPGVSLRLAQYRRSIIDSLTYTLDLNVPVLRSEPIQAFEVISPYLKEIHEPLLLDFKQPADHIKSIIVNGSNVAVDVQQEHIIIPARSLLRGSNKITIDFIAGDASLNRNDDFLYALFVPDRARMAFPCFDQPDLKANFTLALHVPGDWKVLANGVKKDSTLEGGRVQYRFARTEKLPTYLFSFIAGKYKSISKMIDSRNAEFLYRETDPQKIKLSVDSVFEQHRQAIHFLEEWTGIPYPFQKVGFVAIPDFQFGGMEHPGVVHYRASPLFLDEAATKDERMARISLISHETAHMWFGDMVTMRWFNDVWMKEVFANFMADKVTERLMGKETFNLKFLQDHYPAAYGVDRTGGSNPIRQQLDNLQEAGSMYGNIIYHKAPIMMRQLELLMGEAKFQAGVKEYLGKYAYQNATWPDLIAILSRYTSADLNAWNNIWVNETGRPVIDANVAYKKGNISKFVLTQHPEFGPPRIWPQVFAVTLVYPDGEKQLTVNLDAQSVQLTAALGMAKPLYIIYNSNGMGYGLFPVENPLDADQIFSLKNPVHRASVYINLYENMLNGKGYTPFALLQLFEKGLQTEKEETNLRLVTGYINKIYWAYIKPAERIKHSAALEQNLWAAMQQQAPANNKKILFDSYQSIYLNQDASKRIYDIWKTQTPPEGVKLAEDDYTTLAFTIALKSDTATQVLRQQQSRVKNEDRKKRIEFLMPALSVNVAERDVFFNSLKDRKNRAKEVWVTSALTYLHHPLRQSTAMRYVPASLDLLEEIQATGNIFFPLSFISATLGNYQRKEVADMVNVYLKAHPQLNLKLKGKLLQGADNVIRAQKLVK